MESSMFRVRAFVRSFARELTVNEKMFVKTPQNIIKMWL